MNPVPEHIGIIMDGNGRWAEAHGVPRNQGHAAGADVVEPTMVAARSMGVKYLTLYAFSTENWKRSEAEVSALMTLLADMLDAKLDELRQNHIRLLMTGRMEGLPEAVSIRLRKVMRETSEDFQFTLILALNYGGRAEIADAAREIARAVRDGRLDPETVTEETVAAHLYLPEIPDPELIIRTSGESRMSNFLLWEGAYSEFVVVPEFWPDFNRELFTKIIDIYRGRSRRFGGRPQERTGKC